jgi:hypothetical protein
MSMPRVEFEPKISVFGRVKAVQALGRSATMIDGGNAVMKILYLYVLYIISTASVV